MAAIVPRQQIQYPNLGTSSFAQAQGSSFRTESSDLASNPQFLRLGSEDPHFPLVVPLKNSYDPNPRAGDEGHVLLACSSSEEHTSRELNFRSNSAECPPTQRSIQPD